MTSKRKKDAVLDSPSLVIWNRLFNGEIAGADNAAIDEDLIQELLTKRWEAKQLKDFSVADEAAASLRAMGVVYQDESKSWYLRGPEPKYVQSRPVHRTKQQERNKRQAEKNRRNKSKEMEDTGAKSSGEVDAEYPKKKSKL